MKGSKNNVGDEVYPNGEGLVVDADHKDKDKKIRQGMKLYQAIEGIDDVFISKAEDTEANPKPAKKSFIRNRWGLVAACVLFMFILPIPWLFFSSPVKIPLANGVILASLKECNVQTSGIKGLEETLREYVSMPEKLNIASFSAVISPKGIIEDFDLLLISFDDSKNYQGMYRFEYNYGNKQMTYTMPEELEKDSHFFYLSRIYNENFDISYVSEQQKRIPLTQQIPLLNFNKYVLSFASYYLNMGSDMPIIDASSNGDIPVLTLEDYYQGLGGISDNQSGLYFLLYDGVSRIGDQSIIYKLTPLNPSDLAPSVSFTMKCDYRIDNNRMKITRDYGKTWIDTGLSADEIKETMDFYNSRLTLPENSFYISDAPGIIAVIYGETPKLRLSRDDGATWQTISFDLRHNPEESVAEKPIPYRIVGFTSETEGYVALGSGWSMGTGEMKFAYFTHDGGVTWEKKALPLSGTSYILTGMSFADSQNGVLTLKKPFSPDDQVVPLLFFTNDGGRHWTQTGLPEDIPLESVHKADSLSHNEGIYTLICGKGSDNSIKAKFQSRWLSGPWKFVEEYHAIVHTDG